MERYLNRNGNSSVAYYEISEYSITVWFQGTSKSYTYSYRKAGQYHVDQMKILARSGSGLGSYIYRNVRNLYD